MGLGFEPYVLEEGEEERNLVVDLRWKDQSCRGFKRLVDQSLQKSGFNTRFVRLVEKVEILRFGVRSHGGSKQVEFKKLGHDVKTRIHGVHFQKRVWFDVKLYGALENHEAEVIQDNNDDVAAKISHVKTQEPLSLNGRSSERNSSNNIINEKTEELKTHLQIIANDDDDAYTEATPLALKVLVVDYQIHHEHNKPYYKIIRADGTHRLFLSFIKLLKNFDRKDLEALWKLVNERFESAKPKNFSDDFLLNTLKIMYNKPNVKASVWRDQKGRYGLAKVKSWKLFKSCRVHIITLTTTQMILLGEKKYPLTRFTLEQMLNNVRLEVEKESEMSLELLRLMRRRLQEGYIPE
nr:hypothetical protein [Tanacetum cinerariifolium]